MRILSWDEIKARLVGFRSSYPQLQRLLSLGSNNEPNEDTPPLQDDLESQLADADPAAAMEIQSRSPPASSSDAAPAAAMEIESRSPPARSSDAEAKPTSLGELATPAALCVGIYGSIPQDVQLHHQGNALYNPLVTFICLGVVASLCNVIYALVRPDTCGGGDGEYVKRRVMGVTIAFLLVAFVLRVLLVQ